MNAETKLTALLAEIRQDPEMFALLRSWAGEDPKPKKARKPKYIAYTRQITPKAPPVSFSNKPCTVDGVTYRPTWAWSDDYRRHFRSAMRTPRGNPRAAADAYVEWYAKKHGLSYRNAQDRIAETQGTQIY